MSLPVRLRRIAQREYDDAVAYVAVANVFIYLKLRYETANDRK